MQHDREDVVLYHVVLIILINEEVYIFDSVFDLLAMAKC